MTAPGSLPLLSDHSPDSIIAWRHGAAIPVVRFLDDVQRVARELPEGGHVLNVCADRYRFAVGLAATLVAGKVSLLPSTLTPDVVTHLRAFAPDTICLREEGQDEQADLDLPHVLYPEGNAPGRAPGGIPEIPVERQVAWVFTSGSTGTPVPHRKTWGALVRNVRAEGGLLGFRDGRRHTLVGTVPPQHMYGFESTVLVALQNGAAFNAGRPLFPADICSALDAVPSPRALVTTPFHLRTLLDAGIDIPP
ncbi:MAG: beta-hydroxyacyl-ACP dehydratase, partial [Betaproteobacteria bacterium]